MSASCEFVDVLSLGGVKGWYVVVGGGKRRCELYDDERKKGLFTSWNFFVWQGMGKIAATIVKHSHYNLIRVYFNLNWSCLLIMHAYVIQFISPSRVTALTAHPFLNYLHPKPGSAFLCVRVCLRAHPKIGLDSFQFNLWDLF